MVPTLSFLDADELVYRVFKRTRDVDAAQSARCGIDQTVDAPPVGTLQRRASGSGVSGNTFLIHEAIALSQSMLD